MGALAQETLLVRRLHVNEKFAVAKEARAAEPAPALQLGQRRSIVMWRMDHSCCAAGIWKEARSENKQQILAGPMTRGQGTLSLRMSKHVQAGHLPVRQEPRACAENRAVLQERAPVLNMHANLEMPHADLHWGCPLKPLSAMGPVRSPVRMCRSRSGLL
jgi:hypothetical protein